jgi:hypothetical protein
MGVLSLVFGGVAYATRGASRPTAAMSTPPFKADSLDEERFIK